MRQFLRVILCVLFFYPTVFAADISPSEVYEKMSQEAILVDVRTQAEFDAGHIQGALHIPLDQLVDRINELEDYQDTGVILYCRSGNRAGKAKDILTKIGYRSVFNAGGYKDLRK